jgi:YD repeat-containing protein
MTGRAVDRRAAIRHCHQHGHPCRHAATGNHQPGQFIADRLTRNFYDADGKLRGTLDGEGYLVEYKYDAAGELVETVGYANATSVALRVTGTLAQLTPAASAADIHSYMLYNARGQVAGTVDGEGYLTESIYDTAGNTTRVIRYATRVTYTAGATLAWCVRPRARRTRLQPPLIPRSINWRV